MSRRGNPTSRIVHRSSLRPAPLTPTEQGVLRIVREHPGWDVELVGAALGLRLRAAFLASARLLELGRVHVEDGLLYPGAGRS